MSELYKMNKYLTMRYFVNTNGSLGKLNQDNIKNENSYQ